MDYRIPNFSEFSCVLKAQRCAAVNNGRRCKNTCVIGLPYCWIHLHLVKQLRVKDTTLTGSDGQPIRGKGLFAKKSTSDLKAEQINFRDQIVQEDPNDDENIVFKNGTIICRYDGEIISQATLNSRYGNPNNLQTYPPYAAQIIGSSYEDGACKRGVGTLPNHRSKNDPRRNASLLTDQVSRTILVVAVQDIYDGEEIFVFYNRNPNFGIYDERAAPGSRRIRYSTKYAAKNSTKVRDAERRARIERQQERQREENRIQRNQQRQNSRQQRSAAAVQANRRSTRARQR
jgi:hypothetical protein